MPTENLMRCNSVQMAHFSKGNETSSTLVPEREAHAGEALQQRHTAHLAELGMVAECSRQAVIRDTAAQVVDVVDADICREPAENSRQVVMRTAIQGRFVERPLAITGPERRVKLVLHVE